MQGLQSTLSPRLEPIFPTRRFTWEIESSFCKFGTRQVKKGSSHCQALSTEELTAAASSTTSQRMIRFKPLQTGSQSFFRNLTQSTLTHSHSLWSETKLIWTKIGVYLLKRVKSGATKTAKCSSLKHQRRTTTTWNKRSKTLEPPQWNDKPSVNRNKAVTKEVRQGCPPKMWLVCNKRRRVGCSKRKRRDAVDHHTRESSQLCKLFHTN